MMKCPTTNFLKRDDAGSEKFSSFKDADAVTTIRREGIIKGSLVHPRNVINSN